MRLIVPNEGREEVYEVNLLSTERGTTVIYRTEVRRAKRGEPKDAKEKLIRGKVIGELAEPKPTRKKEKYMIN